jgi:general secretion pathway protein D
VFRPRLRSSLLVFLSRLGCIFLFLPLAARAQQQIPPPLPPRPANALIAPGPGVIAPAPGAISGAEKADVQMQFPNAQVRDILNNYEQLTGKRVLADNTVQGQINIEINKPVTRTEAIRLIETALSLNGFSMIPGSGDIIKVLGLGKPARSAGVPIYADLAQLPDNEQVVSFLARLRYLDAQEVVGLLQQYIPPTNVTAFTALQKSGALIVTDTSNSVRRIVNLLAQIDLPASPVVEKFVRLERADATKAVEFLNGVFESKSTPGGGGTPQPGVPGVNTANTRNRPIRRISEDGQPVFEPVPGQNVNLPGGLTALSGESIIQGRIVLTADIRTNRIHVVTQPVNLPLVEKLIADYDSNTPFAEPVRRPLRFVIAREVLPVLVQALTEPGVESAQNAGGAGGAGSRPPPAGNTSSGSNLFGNNNSGGTSNGFGSGSNGSIGSESLNTQAVDTSPTAVTIGGTRLIADQSSNTIILLGGAEAKDKVFQILDQLDVRPQQVIIRAVIGELSLGNNYEYGLNYLLRRKGRAAFSQFSNSFLNTGGAVTGDGETTGSTDLPPTNSSTLSTLTTLAAGLPSGFSGLAGIVSITNSFDVILSALDATNRFKTISRPMIFTSNNKKAIIASGQEIAVPTNSLSTFNGSTADNNAAVSTNVQFKSVTLQLEVVPLINSDREVTLDILQKIDSVVSGQSVQVGGNSIPTIATRYIKSNVSLPNKSTVVLGGLITQNESKTASNVPLLSKIPIVGDLLFKTQTKNANRSELIILLHPEVVNTPALLEAKRQEEEQRIYLGGNLEDQLYPLDRPVRRAVAVQRTTTTTVKKTTRTTMALPAK